MSRHHFLSLALLSSAILTGCSSAPSKQDGPLPSLSTDAPSTRYREQVAVPVPVATPKPLVTRSEGFTGATPAQRPKQPSPRIQELWDEANRLGNNGDYQGKADVLVQAGYYGDGKAFYEAARMYLGGQLPNDAEQAASYINLAHEAGYEEATRVLGLLYLRGQGVPKDMAYGQLLLESASQRSPRAAREYGLLLLNKAQPHLNDWDLGIKKMREASLLGDYNASVILATELEKAGLQDESNEAKTLVEKPIENAKPQLSGVDALKAQALRGNTDAMFQYGQKLLLRKAPSQQHDLDAYCWMTVASELGNRMATNELALLGGIKASMQDFQLERLNQCISDLHSMIKNH